MKKLFIVFCLLFAFNANVYASSEIDLNQTGSITINLKDPDGDQAITKATYTFYKVADICEENGNYSYAYTEEFSKATTSLDDLSSSELCNSLVSYVNEYGISGTAVSVDQDGNVIYSNVPAGLYLAVNTSIQKGYNTTASFLVSVPLEENGEYHYDVNAAPKMSLTKTVEPVPSEIPVTGVVWWPVTVFAVLGILLVSAGYIKKFKYEKNI